MKSYDYGEQLAFTRPSCAVFRVSAGALSHLNKRFVGRKPQYAELAKTAPTGSTAFIRYTIRSDEGRPGGVDLYCSYVRNEELAWR